MTSLAVLMWMGVVAALTGSSAISSALAVTVCTLAVLVEAGHAQSGAGPTAARRLSHFLALSAFIAHLVATLYLLVRA